MFLRSKEGRGLLIKIKRNVIVSYFVKFFFLNDNIR